jgi:hypothetical protein
VSRWWAVLIALLALLGCDPPRRMFTAVCNGVEHRILAEQYFTRERGGCAEFYSLGEPSTTLCGCTVIKPEPLGPKR